MLDHGQGFKDMSPAIESLEELVLNGRLLHGGNPLLTWCMSNVKVSRDPAGNRKFDKRRKNRRIDGAVAAAMAVAAIKKVELQPETGPSVYERRGVLAF
jgi:phage terminase large subunit-like protein